MSDPKETISSREVTGKINPLFQRAAETMVEMLQVGNPHLAIKRLIDTGEAQPIACCDTSLNRAQEIVMTDPGINQRPDLRKYYLVLMKRVMVRRNGLFVTNGEVDIEGFTDYHRQLDEAIKESWDRSMETGDKEAAYHFDTLMSYKVEDLSLAHQRIWRTKQGIDEIYLVPAEKAIGTMTPIDPETGLSKGDLTRIALIKVRQGLGLDYKKLLDSLPPLGLARLKANAVLAEGYMTGDNANMLEAVVAFHRAVKAMPKLSKTYRSEELATLARTLRIAGCGGGLIIIKESKRILNDACVTTIKGNQLMYDPLCSAFECYGMIDAVRRGLTIFSLAWEEGQLRGTDVGYPTALLANRARIAETLAKLGVSKAQTIMKDVCQQVCGMDISDRDLQNPINTSSIDKILRSLIRSGLMGDGDERS